MSTAAAATTPNLKRERSATFAFHRTYGLGFALIQPRPRSWGILCRAKHGAWARIRCGWASNF